MARAPRDSVRDHASSEDENPWVLLLVGVFAAIVALAAIVWELGPVKDLTGWPKAGHIALVAARRHAGTVPPRAAQPLYVDPPDKGLRPVVTFR